MIGLLLLATLASTELTIDLDRPLLPTLRCVQTVLTGQGESIIRVDEEQGVIMTRLRPVDLKTLHRSPSPTVRERQSGGQRACTSLPSLFPQASKEEPGFELQPESLAAARPPYPSCDPHHGGLSPPPATLKPASSPLSPPPVESTLKTSRPWHRGCRGSCPPRRRGSRCSCW